MFLKTQKLNLFLLLAIINVPLISHASNLTRAQELATKAQAALNKFYKAESIRTAIIRSGMALSCLADGVCSSDDLAFLTLASASLITAVSYCANDKKRYTWLPAKFNLIADGIAMLASCDAGWLPITNTNLELQLRSGLSYLSMLTSGVLFLPIKS